MDSQCCQTGNINKTLGATKFCCSTEFAAGRGIGNIGVGSQHSPGGRGKGNMKGSHAQWCHGKALNNLVCGLVVTRVRDLGGLHYFHSTNQA